MELKVLSEKGMKDYMQFDKPHAVISIRSFGAKGLRFKPNNSFRKGLIQLEFDDVTPVETGNWVLMTEEDAKRVAEFIKKHAGVDFMLINCEAGISRSAAIAKAICAWNKDIEPVLRMSHNPNPWVYELILKKLKNE